MRKNKNQVLIEGRVYAHNLTERTVQKQGDNFGKKFINGTLDVAIDEEGINVVTIHYSYVAPTTKSGSPNKTYSALEKIMTSSPAVTWTESGKEAAAKVRVDTAIDLNDFYNNEDKLVSAKRLEGGFITIESSFSQPPHCDFNADMIITNVNVIEPDEEKHIDKEYVNLRGCVFNFRNEILPVDFNVRSADGVKYFEQLEVSGSEPLYTTVYGRVSCNNVVSETSIETAWGNSIVKPTSYTVRDWEVLNIRKTPFEWDDEETITAAELKEAMGNREVYLAEVKKRAEDYKKQKPAAANGVSFATPTSNGIPVKKDTFTF